MLILFRVDSATMIGIGHLMRCLTLADALRRRGATCEFICRNHPHNSIDLVRQQGFRVYELPQAAEPTAPDDLGVGAIADAIDTCQIIERCPTIPDWLIVDHYGIDREWELKLRPYVKRIFAIDDLANRPHDCDVLLDQNYTHHWDRYEGLVPENCCLLLGPEYALLRPEFLAARQKIEAEGRPTFDPRKVLVFFGGTDPHNYTGQALNILKEIGDFAPEVVIGQQNPHRLEIASQMRAFTDGHLHIQTNTMAQIMCRCSWYLGSGGSVTWERMCLGLSGIVVITALNQSIFSSSLSQDNLQIVVEELSLTAIKDAYENYILKIPVSNWLEKCLSIVNIKGSEHICGKIMHLLKY
ncbi:UDP-2,4-diacetamido-2,4,6-trideoxy-beta-L-altropyranose hydrolase [Synechococcus sp. PCC 6716]|nr:UDP-2,4-diacetamido-2,4,6-trideoxy-beta-L-altropyranose hydrolase [Synechococcus sp. PCC 6716]